jgi:hypothetical protein
MNQKDERIKKLWSRGVTDPAQIAKKLGLQTTDRVIEGLKRLKLIQEKT